MQNRAKHIVMWVGLGAGLACVFAGLGAFWLFSGRDTLGWIQQTGVIRIGYAVEAPYAFLTDEGEVTGESPEVAKQIVARMGIARIVWKQTYFEELIAELEANRIDVIAAGMFATPDRKKRVLFSDPTFSVYQGLLVPKGNPHDLYTCPQIATNDHIRIAVLAGSIEESDLRAQHIPDRRLVIVPDVLTGRLSVETGMADVLVLSAPSVRWAALNDHLGKTEAVQLVQHARRPVTGEGAFAFRKCDWRLQRAWNRAQDGFIGTHEHIVLVQPFGFHCDEVTRLFDGANK